ncbi:hypothetical protein ACVINU_005787 [Bradyrhizobium diazoefficiens]
MPDYLFSSHRLSDYLHLKGRDASNSIAEMDPEDILQKPADDLADIIEAHYRVQIPTETKRYLASPVKSCSR